MKFGLFTYGYQRLPLDTAFSDAKRFGYDYIELWGGRPHAFPYDLAFPEELRTLRQLQEAYEIPILVYTPELNAYPYNFMCGTERMRQDAVAYMKRAIEAASAMGAAYTLISAGHGGWGTPRDVLWSRLIRTLEELAACAEACGQQLLLEPLTIFESNILTSADELQAVLDRISSPALKGMCDIVVPFVQHESIFSYFQKLHSGVCHMHITDSNGRNEDHLLPGEGQLPLPELMHELQSIGYTGSVTIELVSNYMNEPSLYAERAINILRACLR